MKTTALAIILSTTTMLTFICSYFFNLSITHYEQYLALIAVVFIDGFFGVIAGTKREGFQTRKAIKVLQTTAVWVLILTVLLSVEQAFRGTGWLSETILVPFMVFQLISALKNASMAGFIKATVLNRILDALDNHKGGRIE
jgi:phage-related holin